MSRLLRYLYTLRYLQPRQVAARLWFRLHRPRPDLRAAPPVRALAGLYQAPIEPQPTLVAPWVFRFLHTERRCLHVDDWQPADVDRLWTYNLHYFDDLNAEVAASRRGWHHDLLERWVAENPPGQGAGWEPYPLSRRIVNWIKWELRGSELPAACRSSLAVQARWLLGRLEYHLLGNHLCANAKALVYAGLFFAGREAEGWYSRGMRILERELRDQVLADGGHFERSTMYHAISARGPARPRQSVACLRAVAAPRVVCAHRTHAALARGDDTPGWRDRLFQRRRLQGSCKLSAARGLRRAAGP